jgi:hypothetical protein
VFWNQEAEGPANHLLGGISKHPLGTRIEQDDFFFGIRHNDGIHCRVDYFRQPEITLGHRYFDSLALGDLILQPALLTLCLSLEKNDDGQDGQRRDNKSCSGGEQESMVAKLPIGRHENVGASDCRSHDKEQARTGAA